MGLRPSRKVTRATTLNELRAREGTGDCHSSERMRQYQIAIPRITRLRWLGSPKPRKPDPAPQSLNGPRPLQSEQNIAIDRSSEVFADG